MERIDILLEEYKTLRQESLTTLSNRTSVLSFGLASICVSISASLGSLASFKGDKSGQTITAFILFFIIPIISNLVLLIWLGEYNRMQRAGRFLVTLEERINLEIKEKKDDKYEPLLSWETTLRYSKIQSLKSEKILFSHMRYPYNATVALLLFLSFLSSSIGGLIFLNLFSVKVLHLKFFASALIFLACTSCFHLFTYRVNIKKIYNLSS